MTGCVSFTPWRGMWSRLWGSKALISTQSNNLTLSNSRTPPGSCNIGFRTLMSKIKCNSSTISDPFYAYGRCKVPLSCTRRVNCISNNFSWQRWSWSPQAEALKTHWSKRASLATMIQDYLSYGHPINIAWIYDVWKYEFNSTTTIMFWSWQWCAG